MVVDDDVDVTNLEQTLWAMLTRTDPKESIQFITGSWDSSADPALPPERRASRQLHPLGGADQRLQAMALARKVSTEQHAESRSRAQGEGKVRLAAQWKEIVGASLVPALDWAPTTGAPAVGCKQNETRHS